MKKYILFSVAMVSSMLAMAIQAPTNLRWEEGDLTFYWDNDTTAEYATFTLDGVQRGFFHYKATSYSPNPQLLSPGNHTFCVYSADAKLNCSDWSCLTIFVEDTIKQTEHQAPGAPYNLSWVAENAYDVTLSWEADDSLLYFSVFLDDRVQNTNYRGHSYTFHGLSPGVHKLGVSSLDADGYVSGMVSLTIQFNMHLQPSVALQNAYWSFEGAQSLLTGLQTVTNNNMSEYAYLGTSAALLQGSQGDVPYLILPAISDVQNYDSLQLTLMARGGYWSLLGKMWARMADNHRLQVGSMPYIPLPEDVPNLLTPLFDTILPYVNEQNYQDYQADSLLFWREIRIPLAGADRYIVLYSECQQNNYVLLDEVRITQIQAESSTGERETEASTKTKTRKWLSPDGKILIETDGNVYDVYGRRTF